ncbi:hypothetical protein PITC_021800 [Penicillium italicum]|uniref:Uncharacterized protein n=1 Tax=Penicillium italicum TaxID=40296 RepID=A0A0A2L219_PENIT|nr:hypothetical protein PITC_021800 [Penicillium italicum]
MMCGRPVGPCSVATPLVASSYIALTQEGNATYEIVSETKPHSRIDIHDQDPTSSPTNESSEFSAGFTPESSHSGKSTACLFLRVEGAEGNNEEWVKEAIPESVAGGVSEVYHSPLTDELFAASPAALALVERGLLARIAQMAVNMRAIKEDVVAIRARREQLAASRVAIGTSMSACWSAGVTPPDAKL